MATFQRSLERYKAEFKIIGRNVYLQRLIGHDTDNQYRHRLNASNIVKEIDAQNMWTYARGYADYDDDEDGWKNAKIFRENTSHLASMHGSDDRYATTVA